MILLRLTRSCCADAHRYRHCRYPSDGPLKEPGTIVEPKCYHIYHLETRPSRGCDCWEQMARHNPVRFNRLNQRLFQLQSLATHRPLGQLGYPGDTDNAPDQSREDLSSKASR